MEQNYVESSKNNIYLNVVIFECFFACIFFIALLILMFSYDFLNLISTIACWLYLLVLIITIFIMIKYKTKYIEELLFFFNFSRLTLIMILLYNLLHNEVRDS